MKVDYRSYRIITVALLFVLFINLLLPVSVKALDLFCNMETAEWVKTDFPNTAGDCCTTTKIKKERETLPVKLQRNNSCSIKIKKFCELSVADTFKEYRSLLPPAKFLMKAALPIQTLVDISSLGQGAHSRMVPASTLSYPTPPIFLLILTFLN